MGASCYLWGCLSERNITRVVVRVFRFFKRLSERIRYFVLYRLFFWPTRDRTFISTRKGRIPSLLWSDTFRSGFYRRFTQYHKRWYQDNRSREDFWRFISPYRLSNSGWFATEVVSYIPTNSSRKQAQTEPIPVIFEPIPYFGLFYLPFYG